MKKLILLPLFFAFSAQADFDSAKQLFDQKAQSSMMTVCERQKSTVVNDDNLRDTYYDLQHSAFEMVDHYGSAFSLCTTSPRYHYRDQYVIKYGGSIPAYWTFPRGLVIDYRRNNNTISLDALNKLADNASYCRLANSTESEYLKGSEASREAAYCMELYLEKRILGHPAANLETFRDFVRGHFTQWFEDHTAPRTKSFMVGISAWALIDYKERYNPGYPLIAIMQKAADELWTKMWDEPSQSFKYALPVVAGDNPPQSEQKDLNLLIAPLYAWVYKQTGIVSYRDKADKIFEAGVNGACWSCDGKHINQQLYWIFDFFKWRTGANSTPFPTPTPTPTATPTPVPSPTPCGITATLKNHQCRLNKLEAK